MAKKILKPIFIVLAIFLLIIAAYVSYVFLSYYRLDDRLELPVEGIPETQAEFGTPYRIASYNVGFGAYSADYTFFMDGGKESRARSAQAVLDNTEGALGALETVAPDLVLFQEVDVDSTRSYHIDQAALISEQMDGFAHVFAQNYDSPYLFYPILEPHGASLAGQVTYSKFSITSALRRSVPIEEGVMKLLDLDRCYSVSRIPLSDGKELLIYNLHLSAYTSDGTISTQQLECLFADMLEEYKAGNYIIGGGDFNKDLLGNSAEVFSAPNAEAYTWAQPIPEGLCPDGLQIVAPYEEENPVPSCRNPDIPYGEDSFVVTVDGFILSDNVKLLDAKVIDTGFSWSDHNPVYLDFELIK